ncbi:GGDEF domain-containing protein [Moritella marina ATCC 15381]|uniref:GGDEF domain-containing protein n=1 Tax=Moritella marina ATCC 15381 TaxID=1202962 RepID=A0A5J6WL72_MORMI|nr:GGDEF domain-containing protein [Moritella marina]QFI38747.1 GGDEF domain-containing protein [Moritella marina ATCC 15381]
MKFIILLLVFFITPNKAFAKKYHVGFIESDVISAFVFRNIADELSIDFEYHYYDNLDELLSLLDKGYLDFSSDLAYTVERESFLDFSAPVHIDPSYIFTRHKFSKSHIHRILTPKGSGYESLIRQQLSGMYFEEYDDSDSVFSSLDNDEFDAVIGSVTMLENALDQDFKAERISTVFDISPVSIATKKGRNPALMKVINRFLSKNFLQNHVTKIMNTNERNTRIISLRKKLILSDVDANNPIIFKVEDLEKDGNAPVNGLSLSIVKSACSILGLNCQLVNCIDEEWEDIYNALDKKSIDMITAMVISEQRKEQFYFSDPYYQLKLLFVSRLGYKTNQYHRLSELVGERIGVISGDYFDDFITQRLPKKRINRFSNQNEMLDALLNGDVDYIPLGETNFNKLMRNKDNLLPLSHVKSISTDINMGIAIAFQFNTLGEHYARLFSAALPLVDVESIINLYGVQPDWKSALLAEIKYIRFTLLSFAGVVILLLLFIYSLYIQTSTDLLSKLGNRRALVQRFKSGVKSEYVFVYMDINNFKRINDYYGHHVGDKVLVALARNIQCYWPGKAYRIGGDEFVLTFNKMQADVTNSFQHLQRFSFTIKETGETLDVSLSLGISLSRNECVSLEDLLRDIDKKMYRDKKTNRALISA